VSIIWCADVYVAGDCAAEVFGQALPICGVAGDQQAAVVGQACFEAGDVKSTYGTGCFMLVNTGQNILLSKNNLLSTIAYQIDGQRTYGIEGSIFVSGAIIQWLRDGMGLFSSASQTEELATKISSNEGVYMVPALTGLGAPHWAADARGAIYGITRDTGPEHFVRAALESVAYQSRDLIEAMRSDGIEPKGLKVDGGMTANNWLMQFIADILDLSIERPAFTETTALGAAVLAMLGSQQIRHLRDAENLWKPEKTFTPLMLKEDRDRLLAGWQLSIKRTLVN
jgi:glycerol kinase